MPIRNSFSILSCNFKLAFKILMVMIVIILIAVSITTAILDTLMEDFIEFFQSRMTSADEILSHPVAFTKNILIEFSSFVESNQKEFNMSILNLVILIVCVRFLCSITILPTGKYLYSKLTTNFDSGLLNNFLTEIPKNLVFSLVTSVVFSLLDLLILTASIFLCVYLLNFLGVVAFTVGLGFFIFGLSLREAIVCQWLPEILKNEKADIFKALALSMKPAIKQFSKNFICIFVLKLGFMGIVLATLVPTAGLLPLVFFPSYIVLSISLQLTLSFAYYRKKYYVDNGTTIYNPVKKF